ncbi:ribonuclease [Streptomyces albus subsp. chlorinus]|uniref:ribonuclease domain-containing protein n=1 Tax=Streptomyces albus TaxID=1888 RepID=UPI0015710535|nr:ribonuclease [Streptomyces albus]NSC24562.1 ribonuclease [Streptomyces albus subsp. chlorinus]
MRFPPRISRIGAAGALAAALLAGGPVLTTASAAPAHPVAATQQVSVAAVGDICLSKLPPEAHETLDLIEQGGPYPYPQDGTVFQNREGVLPDQPEGYYHEYTVETPGSDDRGARRIVTGDKEQEDYYTADHYASFDLVDHSC